MRFILIIMMMMMYLLTAIYVVKKLFQMRISCIGITKDLKLTGGMVLHGEIMRPIIWWGACSVCTVLITFIDISALFLCLIIQLLHLILISRGLARYVYLSLYLHHKF